MIESIELQMISKILTTDSEEEIDVLCSFDESYYSIFKDQIKFILDHRIKYGNVPDIFTFQAQFPDVTLVQVRESIQFLKESIQENKQYIILLETFNKIKELGSADVKDAWKYIGLQYERILSLDSTAPMDIIHQARERADEVVRFSKQSRIPTGFDEIDKLMYGGFSTVEELVIVVARTNTGKAQPLWSKVLTPSGWTTIGELKVGDVVVGKNNDNGKVIRIFPQGIKKYFRVHFDDGTYTECCDDHLWEVVKLSDRLKDNLNYEVITLKDIRESFDTYTVDLCGDLRSSVDSFFINSCNYIDVDRMTGFHVFEQFGDEFLHPDRAFKTIEYIEYVGETECQCILIDNESHTYITDGFTVTHNSWVMTKMMESAQSHKFPCLYYSPEMQASFLGTRFDTWRKHFQNSQLYRGNYNEEYRNYIKDLEKEETPAFILEDKDVSEGSVNVPVLESLVKRYGIKLLIIDGLSYMEDNRSRYSDRDYEKYKNLSTDLFKLSKRYGCAVVVAMQANRESKDSKDDKGEIFPTAMNIEGSDHPARIATQVFSIRQIFERHVLDIRLEKSRMANNQKPILSYSWDINTGNIQNISGEDSGNSPSAIAPTSNIVTSPKIIKHVHDDSELLDDDDFDDVEF